MPRDADDLFTEELIERLREATGDFSQQGAILVPPREAQEFILSRRLLALTVSSGCPIFLRQLESGTVRITAFPNTY